MYTFNELLSSNMFMNSLEDYFSFFIISNLISTAEWWSTYGAACPNLARLAVRILSQTCSSLNQRPHHILLEEMHDAKNSLEHQRLSDLVFVQYNWWLRER